MNQSSLFSFFFTSFFFLSLVILSGCTNQEEKEITQKAVSEPVPVLGGIYRAPLRSNPATLDPAYVQNEYGVSIVKQLFDGLVRFDPYLSVLPALAETWQVKEKGKVYRFTLRKNARFHNLEPVTPKDVVFSFNRLLRAEPAPAPGQRNTEPESGKMSRDWKLKVTQFLRSAWKNPMCPF